MPKPKIYFLVGPTAIGKTAIAAILAQKIKAEIISCDSMQIYKGMDIISSKAPAVLRKRIAHHMIDIISCTKEYNVSSYRQKALKVIKGIFRRNRVPLFVGGTGLYMSVMIDGIFKDNTQDQTTRARLYKDAKLFGSGFLYQRLSEIDPLAAAKIHPNDTKRIIRALEVFQTSGKPISQLQKEREGLRNNFNVKIFCLDMERDKLYARIDQRVEEMFRVGLIDEVKRLTRSRLSKTASFAIGIKEVKGYMEGLYDLEEAKRLMKKNTRNYAKRQLTWFRKDKHIEWVKLGAKESPQHIAQRILTKIKKRERD